MIGDNYGYNVTCPNCGDKQKVFGISDGKKHKVLCVICKRMYDIQLKKENKDAKGRDNS
jgi:hypothetical protein